MKYIFENFEILQLFQTSGSRQSYCSLQKKEQFFKQYIPETSKILV
jgi:hypothetical protein